MSGSGGMPQQVVGLHDQPRRAEAALHRAGVDERLLHRVQAVAGKPLDGHDVAAFGLAGRDQAGAHGHVVEQDGARSALALLARVLRARQRQPLAQHEQQALALPLVLGGRGLAVDRQPHPHRGTPSPCRYESQAQPRVRRASTPRAWRRYAAVPRTSSMGRAAAATSSPNRCETSPGIGAADCHSPAPASAPARKAAAPAARSGGGPADPMPEPTVAAPGDGVPPSPGGRNSSANAHTAMTIAFLVPILANCCGPRAGGTSTAVISSSAASALRLGPRKNSAAGISRLPRTDAACTAAPAASSTGWQSPAGEAAPRLPPTVPRLRICGEPTVRAAIASPGSRPPSSAITWA